jgi:hypothetical protein
VAELVQIARGTTEQRTGGSIAAVKAPGRTAHPAFDAAWSVGPELLTYLAEVPRLRGRLMGGVAYESDARN